MSPASEPLRERLRAALPAAMRERDKRAISAIRSALAAIENAEAVTILDRGPLLGDGGIAGASAGVGSGDVPRRQLGEEDVANIVREEIADRHRVATDYEAAGHDEQAGLLRTEASVLIKHLGE